MYSSPSEEGEGRVRVASRPPRISGGWMLAGMLPPRNNLNCAGSLGPGQMAATSTSAEFGAVSHPHPASPSSEGEEQIVLLDTANCYRSAPAHCRTKRMPTVNRYRSWFGDSWNICCLI